MTCLFLSDECETKMFVRHRTDFTRAARFVFFISLVCCTHHIFAADKATKIQEAIRRGQFFLSQQKLEGTGSIGSLAGLALLKSQSDRNALPIQQLIRDVLQKCVDDTYRPGGHHIYEASVDLMLLESADSKLLRPQIEAIAKYLIEAQCDNGAWYYPDRTEPDAGDTSITQYAILGLWAAARAGVVVPTAVWEKAAKWHFSTQRSDGGFAYHPFPAARGGQKDQISRSTMTCAGTSNLLIIRQVLFAGAAIHANTAVRRFGVLERFTDERTETRHTPTIRLTAFDDAVKNSLRWMGRNFAVKSPDRDAWYTYEWYCVERVGALLGSDEIEDHEWYSEGSDELVARQAKDGSWKDECRPIASTALCLLFLSKATQQLFKPGDKISLVGAGLQAGGRGLPDNLNAVQNKDGKISARKLVGAIDNLLIELERASDAKVEDVQAAIIDEVQFERKDELIGQTTRLRKLAVDQRPEVRRVAFWALARSQDIKVAPLLIRGLAERDITIAREASLGLCILARLPDGQGVTIDPTIDLQLGIKEDATDEERAVVREAWSKESIRRWTNWYQKIRPYDERDDRTSLTKSGR